jgi:autotransporter-associated beta strand protein
MLPAQAENQGGSQSYDGGRGGAGTYKSFGMGENGWGGNNGSATGGHWGMEMRGPGAVTGPGLSGGYGLDGTAGTVNVGGGGGGGGGGTALRIVNQSNGENYNKRLSITGGRGGNGGDSGQVGSAAEIGAGAGGGGGGGDGIELHSSMAFRFVNEGIVTGGAGGHGGQSNVQNGMAGGGGAGGNALNAALATGVVITNRSTLTGGDGGNSVSGSAFADYAKPGAGGVGAVLGDGMLGNVLGAAIMGGNSGFSGTDSDFTRRGDGGVGVLMGGGTLTNDGTISGGVGNNAYGVKVTGAGTVINAGSIKGGKNADDIRASAVLMAGIGGRLELRNGYDFEGQVSSTSSGNVLALGGDADSSFNLTNWGVDYVGFANDIEKIGNSTWELTGGATQAPNWTVKSGTLSFTDGEQFGGSGNTIMLGNAGLALRQTAKSTTLNAAVSITAAGGTISVADDSILTIGTPVSGGALTKEGTGTLVLTGANSYTGGTIVNDGTLALGAGGSLAVGSTVNLGAAGAFDISMATSAELGALNGVGQVALGVKMLTVGAGHYDGVIAGSGGVVKDTAGVLTLTGANSYTGGTIVNDGTLALGEGGS